MNELYSNNLNGTPWVKEWGDAAISEAETRARREVSVDRGWERGGWKEISLLKKFKKKNVFDFIFPWPLFLFIIKLYLTLIKNLHTTPKNCGVCVGGGWGVSIDSFTRTFFRHCLQSFSLTFVKFFPLWKNLILWKKLKSKKISHRLPLEKLIVSDHKYF